MVGENGVPETPDWSLPTRRLWTLDEVCVEFGIDERDSIADAEIDARGTE